MKKIITKQAIVQNFRKISSQIQRSEKLLKSLVTGIVIIFISLTTLAQEGFEILIDSEMDEYPRDFIQDANGGFTGIVWKSETSNYTDWEKSYIYKISPDGDTLSRLFTIEDTIIVLHKIIQAETTPLKYLVSGTGYREGSDPRVWFSYFAMLNENLDVLWDKSYFLDDPADGILSLPQLLKEGDSSYLFATGIASTFMYLFRMNNLGDSVLYRAYETNSEYDSAGKVYDLTYNYDSTAYWLHTHFAHYDPTGPESQCISLDFNLNQVEVNYYPRWLSNVTAKLLPDRNLIAGSMYWYRQYPPGAYYLAAFKIDTAFHVIDSCYYTDPEVKTRGGVTSIDYYFPNCIFTGGTEGYKVGIWIPYPSWYAIAKMDNDLNLVYEKYIGGDAYYDFSTITASNDGGVLVTGTRYDYLNQDFERDALIIKLDSSDFTVGQNEHNFIKMADAIVYPNPGNDYLNIRTSLKNVNFRLFDSNGHLVIEKKLDQLITVINTEQLKPGTYLWQIADSEQIYETAKWLKVE